MKKKSSLLNSWKALLVLGLLVVGGTGLVLWKAPLAGSAATSPTKSPYETFSVRRGNLANSVSGSGTIVADKSVDLGFPVSGQVAEVNVQLGDKVTSGQTLATMDGLETLKQDVENKQLALQTAQKNLADLKANAAATVAQALADQSQAQSDYDTAKSNLRFKGVSRCDAGKIIDLYYKYTYASRNVNLWQSYLDDGNTSYGTNFILKTLRPMKREQYLDAMNLTYCEGFTDQEILTSQANLDLAKANLDAAQKKYQDLVANSGLLPQDLAIAEAGVKNAELQLAVSKSNIESATIISPIDGTVTAINGSSGQLIGVDSSGETVTIGTFMTVADLDHPQVKVNIDQTDLQSFTTGCSTQVTFDAFPGKTYTGEITQILPEVTAVRSVNVIQALVKLDTVALPSGRVLPVGMNANVEVTCEQANNVLFMPIQSLYQPAGQTAYVYVLNSQNQPEKREVEVGLKATAFIEVTSGLSEGEKVITTPITTP
jgi:HlyD family secretion protein